MRGSGQGGSACSSASSRQQQGGSRGIRRAGRGRRFAADHLRRNQHAFEQTVRVAFEVESVLEGAGLAFVHVDRQQARRRVLAHDAPLAPGRKARAAEAAQARGFQRVDHLLCASLSPHHGGRQPVAALRAVGVERQGVVCHRGLRRFRQRPWRVVEARGHLRGQFRHPLGGCRSRGHWPTCTAGACSQRPTQGAGITPPHRRGPAARAGAPADRPAAARHLRAGTTGRRTRAR